MNKGVRGKKERVAVFIDGSNLYFKLRTAITHKMDFIHYRYRDLFASIYPESQTAYIGYYIGVVKQEKRSPDKKKTAELRKNQQKLFDQLTHQNIKIQKGYLLEHDGKYFEKGVDVRLAIDIVAGAYEDVYDRAIVVSSDTDLIPAIQKAQSLNKQVTYLGFEHQPSLALVRYASHTKLLDLDKIERYQAKKLKIRRFDDVMPPKKQKRLK